MRIYPVVPAYRVLVFWHSENPVYDISCSSLKEAKRLYNKYSEQSWKACAIWSARHNGIIMRIGRIPEQFTA